MILVAPAAGSAPPEGFHLTSDSFKDPAHRIDAHELEVASGTRTYVVAPVLSRRAAEADGSRSPAAKLDEAIGLAAAIDLNVVGSVVVTLAEIRPSTYIGKGKVDEIKTIVEAEDIILVLMDCALSPVQQRNLERALGAKVIDRTGLILEIFGRRARTKEGTLQVELAHLNYQKGRLVRSWTTLNASAVAAASSAAPVKRRSSPTGACCRIASSRSSANSNRSSARAHCIASAGARYLIRSWRW